MLRVKRYSRPIAHWLALTILLLGVVAAILLSTRLFAAHSADTYSWTGDITAGSVCSPAYEIGMQIASGTLYAVDSNSQTLQSFNLNGDSLDIYHTDDSPAGSLSHALGVTRGGPDNHLYIADSNNDRILVLDATGNYISTIGSAGTGNGQFDNPENLRFGPDGKLYVVDTANNRVQVLEPDGTYIRQFGNAPELLAPQSIAFDTDGNVYITDTGHNRVARFDASGVFLNSIGSTRLANPQALDISPSGSLYVTAGDLTTTAPHEQRVLVYNPSTAAFLSTFGSSGTGDGQFTWAQGIAVDATGDIFVTDNRGAAPGRIQKFNSTGTYISQFSFENHQTCQPLGMTRIGTTMYVADASQHVIKQYSMVDGSFLGSIGGYGTGNGQLNTPYGVTAGPDGNLYVADTMNHRIQVFAPDGSYIRQFGSVGVGAGQFQGIVAVAFDENGDVYATDYMGGRVHKFTSMGSYISSFGSIGTGDGQFQQATGVAVAPDGSIFVADLAMNRVQKFTNTGVYVGQIAVTAPAHITTDATGQLFVASLGGGVVAKYDSNTLSLITTVNAGQGTADGELIQAGGVLLAPGGVVYASDPVSGKISMFNSESLTVTINQAVGQADPTNINSAQFTIVFSSPVSGFTASDITLTGTTGTITGFTTIDNVIFTATVTGMTSGDTVVATVAAGVASDAGATPNAASTSIDNQVTYDVTLPIVTIDTPPPITPSNQAAYPVSGTCTSGDSDVELMLGTAPTVVTASVTCTPDGTYSTSVDVSSLPNGSVVIHASQSDIAGNVANAADDTIKDTAVRVVEPESEGGDVFAPDTGIGSLQSGITITIAIVAILGFFGILLAGGIRSRR